MQFSLAYVKSNQQFILQTFSQNVENNSIKIMDLEFLKKESIQGIIVPNELLQDDTLFTTLTEECKFAPIKASEEIGLNSDSFEGLNYETAKSTYEGLVNNWTLQNNINLLDELFPVLTHLKGLFPNDRTAFFEELWFLLKTNLGAHNLKMIYNHMKKGKKDGEKNQLIQVKIDGNRHPEPQPGDEFSSQLMSVYKNSFENIFEVADFDPHKGELVLTATINKSPVIIMANVTQFSRLQKSLIKAIFTGLQS